MKINNKRWIIERGRILHSIKKQFIHSTWAGIVCLVHYVSPFLKTKCVI